MGVPFGCIAATQEGENEFEHLKIILKSGSLID
jgi:hypothetical protein